MSSSISDVFVAVAVAVAVGVSQIPYLYMVKPVGSRLQRMSKW